MVCGTQTVLKMLFLTVLCATEQGFFICVNTLGGIQDIFVETKDLSKFLPEKK